MNLLEFFNRFPDEYSCKKHLQELRVKKGVICRKCKYKEHYWLQTKAEFKCKKCKTRSVMQSSKLPYQYWYATMHLMTSTKKSFSAKELQRQLGHKRYEPIWVMMHKLELQWGKEIKDTNLQTK